MRKIVSFFTLLMLATVLTFAQTRPISGRVVDDKGQPVGGATVALKGSSKGTSADADGNFTINAKTGDILVITALNSKPQEVVVTKSNAVVVRVATSGNDLATVTVATSLGIQRQAKSLGISTANVKSAELIQARPTNLQNGLTGKVSGLNIQTVNNGVFADTRITLRGIRSLTGNNQPMLILDGVPIALGYLNSLNPNDVQDVSILKSSSATAIYGPEGVNGAIVVTTKKGSARKPTITLSHTTQVESVAFMPKLQTRFGSGSSVDRYGYGVYDPIENQCYGPEFNGSTVQIGRDDPNGNKYLVTYSPKPNEKRKFWNNGVTNQTDVSFATGDFYLSAQNVDIKGVLPKDENHRRTIRMKAIKEYGKFNATFNLNFTNNSYDVNAGGNFGNGRDYLPYWLLINTPMQIPITQFKDWKNDFWASPNGYFSDYYSNPYWAIDNFRERGRSTDILGNVELNYKAANWLNFTYRFGGTVTAANSKTTQGSLNYSPFALSTGKAIASTGDIPAAVVNSNSLSSRLTSEFFVTAKKDLKDFKIDGLLGYSFREIRSSGNSINTQQLGVPGVFNPSVRAIEVLPSQADQINRLQRGFGRVGLSYKNWAFFEATGSVDQDSRLTNPYNFDLGKATFFYPGANVSFVLSDAINGLKKLDFLSYLKVRGAISRTGNVNLGNFQTLSTFTQPGYFPFGNLIGFAANNTLLTSNVRPEFVNNKEVGIEMSFLKNRINLEGTYYTQNNTDQMLSVSLSNATGYSTFFTNAAAFTNRGFEIDLKLTPLVRIGKTNITLKLNYTNQSNQVTSILDGIDELSVGNFNYVVKGQPAYVFKMSDYVRDPQGRVVIQNNTKGLPRQDPTIKQFGQTLPRHLFGMSFNVDYKALTLSVVADYRSGNQINNYFLGNAMDFTGISARSALNGRQPFLWPNSVIETAPGKYEPNTTVYTTGGYDFYSQDINTQVPSNYLSSGAFWKLREVSLTYTMPSKWFANKPIRGATFTLSGRNLFMWLPATNQWTDPEFSTGTGNALGVSGLGNTPPTRLFGANLTVNF